MRRTGDQLRCVRAERRDRALAYERRMLQGQTGRIPIPIPLDRTTLGYFAVRCAGRNITVTDLMRVALQNIARDDLMNAVIDEKMPRGKCP